VTTYYVGAGGNDGNAGTSWALRKLTLNGAEDIPVMAGDTVYVGPGVYRELLTVDVSGGAGTPITYIGDVTGEHTDQVGGVVRITGSDNDQSPTRNYCIDDNGTQRNYRTFRGFILDSVNNYVIRANAAGTNWIIEDCGMHGGAPRIYVNGANQADWTVKRCIFIGDNTTTGLPILFTHAATVDDTGHVIENCICVSTGRGVRTARVGGITVRNCLFIGLGSIAVSVGAALSIGQTVTVNNAIITACGTGMQATVLGEIVEDYNNFYNNNTDRTNVAVGANSLTYIPIFSLPVLNAGASQASGYKFPWWFGSLSEWSQVRAVTGSNEPAVDLFGVARPATAAKNSWGPVQWQGQERDTATVRGGSASLKLPDAGRAQFYVPTDGTAITISVYVYHEANYAGTLPQMVIKQPGQADRTTTDVGAAGGWNQLTDTFTPDASTDFVVVELVSNNTAAAGNYATYFDDLSVS